MGFVTDFTLVEMTCGRALRTGFKHWMWDPPALPALLPVYFGMVPKASGTALSPELPEASLTQS